MATMEDDKPIFLDTNVLIQATIETAPFHSEIYKAVNHLWVMDHPSFVD